MPSLAVDLVAIADGRAAVAAPVEEAALVQVVDHVLLEVIEAQQRLVVDGRLLAHDVEEAPQVVEARVGVQGADRWHVLPEVFGFRTPVEAVIHHQQQAHILQALLVTVLRAKQLFQRAVLKVLPVLFFRRWVNRKHPRRRAREARGDVVVVEHVQDAPAHLVEPHPGSRSLNVPILHERLVEAPPEEKPPFQAVDVRGL